MQFEFATANRIIFGPGTLRQVGSLAVELGKRALVLTGWTPERTSIVSDALAEHEVASVTQPVVGEPTTDSIRTAVDLARMEHCDLIIGFGGGSAIDSAKATAAMLTNEGELLDYL